MLPSGSVRVAFTGTPNTRLGPRQGDRSHVILVGDCYLYVLGAAVALLIGGHQSHLVYVVPVSVSRRLVVGLRLERERAA